MTAAQEKQYEALWGRLIATIGDFCNIPQVGPVYNDFSVFYGIQLDFLKLYLLFASKID